MFAPFRRVSRGGLLVLLGATVAYVALLVAVALAAGGAEAEDVRGGAIDSAEAQLAVLSALEAGVPEPKEGPGSVSAEDAHHLDTAVAQLAAEGDEVRLRLWGGDGSTLYRSANDRGPAEVPDREQALRGRPWSVERPATASDRAELVTYRPVIVDGRLQGVFEIARPLQPVLDDEAAEKRGLYLSVAIVGGVLWLGLLPVSLVISKLAAAAWDPRRQLLLRRVRRGILAGELELHYQPKISLESGEMDGVEALVRWRRGARLVPPGEFLPAVEQSPLIRRLTLFVLDAALAQARRWADEGRSIGIAVNLAPANLADPRIVGDVQEALRRHGVDPSRLTLEVTETAVLEDEESAGAVLGRLAELGITLAVDDFGTGHSSLARVTRHPFTELKIDRSFVMELTRQERPVVATMVMLAKTLGLRVVAEGVEDEATLNALHGLDCDVAQGFLLGRPAPAADLPAATRHIPEASQAGLRIRSLLDDLRESLGLDAAFVAEFVDQDEVFRWTSGEAESFGTGSSSRRELCDTYCSRVVSGVFPNLIPDTHADPGARDLEVTSVAKIGAYVGVPLHRADGTLYGTLCGLDHRARPDLTAEDVEAVEEFAARISPLLSSANLAMSAR